MAPIARPVYVQMQLKWLEVTVLAAVYENEFMNRCSDAGATRRGAKRWHTPSPPPPPAAVCSGLVMCLPSEDSRTHTWTQRGRGRRADCLWNWSRCCRYYLQMNCRPSVLRPLWGQAEFTNTTIDCLFMHPLKENLKQMFLGHRERVLWVKLNPTAIWL